MAMIFERSADDRCENWLTYRTAPVDGPSLQRASKPTEVHSASWGRASFGHGSSGVSSAPEIRTFETRLSLSVLAITMATAIMLTASCGRNIPDRGPVAHLDRRPEVASVSPEIDITKFILKPRKEVERILGAPKGRARNGTFTYPWGTVEYEGGRVSGLTYHFKVRPTTSSEALRMVGLTQTSPPRDYPDVYQWSDIYDNRLICGKYHFSNVMISKDFSDIELVPALIPPPLLKAAERQLENYGRPYDFDDGRAQLCTPGDGFTVVALDRSTLGKLLVCAMENDESCYVTLARGRGAARLKDGTRVWILRVDDSIEGYESYGFEILQGQYKGRAGFVLGDPFTTSFHDKCSSASL